jgi:uncharacterized protein YbjT (DUF2867 family)
VSAYLPSRFLVQVQPFEKHIERLGVPYTIVAPVYFMENLLAPWTLPELEGGRLPMALPSSRPLQQIALSDIAAFIWRAARNSSAGAWT